MVAVTTVRRTRLYNITSLATTGGGFNEAERKEFQAAMWKSAGAALAVVHPIFTKCAKGDNICLEKEYGSFLSRFNEFVAKTDHPALIFCQQGARLEVEDWIFGLDPDIHVAMIDTEKDNPLPVVPSIGQYGPRWSWLINVLRGLDVKQLSIIGESYYTLKGRKSCGCVSDVQDSLEHWFVAKVISDLTYPNTNFSQLPYRGPQFFS